MLIFSLLLNMQSHPTWVRGLKLLCFRINLIAAQVAPYVGAWIETFVLLHLCTFIVSHPTWVRGLKLKIGNELFTDRWSHPTWVRGLKRV